ncbi:MAG: neutral/alkaline non-lysosomal ceramidase N-terminal domain-containing protein [Planctomycetaceae bacterium]
MLCADESLWKAGVAKADITPQKALWMAGYGGRTKPAEGQEMPLWVRALALEDAAGHRAVILSSDTLGIPQPLYEAIAERLAKKHGLTKAQFLLGASHTHCGPVLKGSLYDAYPLTEELIADITVYSDNLVEVIVEAIGQALQNLKPARVSRGVGQTDFAVNRRTNREPDVPMLREQNLLLGPVDHSVPVLAVHDEQGRLTAVVFGYACHNTVMDYYLWSGDYAGFAQRELEQNHPGATAMFLMGCGADQNPLPRRKVELAQKYGSMLASAVDAVLKEELTPLKSQLETTGTTVDLRLGSLPSDEELKKLAAGSAAYISRWATRMLKWKESNQPIPKTYSYPIQAWRLGGQQLLLTMGGEVVVDYDLRFKAEFGDQTWIFSYCNDVMAYIPSERVLLEGGYEGQSSMFVYGMPCAKWADGVEASIAAGMKQLVEQLER